MGAEREVIRVQKEKGKKTEREESLLGWGMVRSRHDSLSVSAGFYNNNNTLSVGGY